MKKIIIAVLFTSFIILTGCNSGCGGSSWGSSYASSSSYASAGCNSSTCCGSGSW